MECGLLAADSEQVFHCSEALRVVAGLVEQFGGERVVVPAVAIDAAVVAGEFEFVVVVLRCQQAVNVDARHAFEGQHDRVCAEEALLLPFVWAFAGALQGVVQCDVDFVWLVGAAGDSTPGDARTEALHGVDQFVEIFLAQ